MKKFNTQGVEGLEPKSKGRPSMTKKRINKRKKKKKLTREKELKRENEWSYYHPLGSRLHYQHNKWIEILRKTKYVT